MKFYELPPAVNNSIQNTDIRPYVRVLFELKDEDLFIPNSDILECVITSYKSVDGGIINNGYINLDNKKTQKNWTDTQTVVHSVVCDKENPDNSLVHIIAKRAGLEPSQINCGHLPFNLPFVFIDNTAWKELCSLAKTYNACVECGKDMALSFIESPYDTENTYSKDSGFFLTEKEIISETNFSYFVKDDSEIKEHGQIVKNVTSKYLSDDLIENVPFYKHRANDLLNESKKDTKGYYLITYLPLIHARVDACMDIRLRSDGAIKKVKLEEITFRYKKEAAFSTEMWVKTVQEEKYRGECGIAY